MSEITPEQGVPETTRFIRFAAGHPRIVTAAAAFGVALTGDPELQFVTTATIAAFSVMANAAAERKNEQHNSMKEKAVNFTKRTASVGASAIVAAWAGAQVRTKAPELLQRITTDSMVKAQEIPVDFLMKGGAVTLGVAILYYGAHKAGETIRPRQQLRNIKDAVIVATASAKEVPGNIREKIDRTITNRIKDPLREKATTIVSKVVEKSQQVLDRLTSKKVTRGPADNKETPEEERDTRTTFQRFSDRH